MCGIIGYTGKRNALPILLDGLYRLEYRGYDSAGIAIAKNSGEIVRVRVKGEVINLRSEVTNQDIDGFVGIAHTRWATHGIPSVNNAHPHTDCGQEFFVVHNGIIENYLQLHEKLKSDGHIFTSDTDTEILAHLIEENFKGDLSLAVRDAIKQVEGAYAIAAISSKSPGELVAARFGSPLTLGLGDNELVVASDLTAIIPITREVLYLQDGEMVTIRDGRYDIMNLDNKKCQHTTTTIDWTAESAEKQGYPHFMLKEIFEQPEAITNSLRGRLLSEQGTSKLGGLESVEEQLRQIDRIVIIAMGTSRNAALVGEYMLEEYAGIPTEIEFSSEFSYRRSSLTPSTAVIAISQSGETADTRIALAEAKRKGALTLGIVNVVGSHIAQTTDAGVYNHIGPEKAVASTKAFVSQVAILALISLCFGRTRELDRTSGQEIVRGLQSLPSLIKQILDNVEQIKNMADSYKHYDHFLYLGRKYNYPIALEGALKLKEVAYVHAEGYNGGEMKHGPIALIDKDFPTCIVIPSDSVYDKNLGHIREIQARSGRVLAIATEGNTEIKNIAEDVIYIPRTLEMLTPIISVIPLQLLAYYIAVARGYNPDKPRNLAKSVTVE